MLIESQHNLCQWAAALFVLNFANLWKIGCLSTYGCDGCSSNFIYFLFFLSIFI